MRAEMCKAELDIFPLKKKAHAFLLKPLSLTIMFDFKALSLMIFPRYYRVIRMTSILHFFISSRRLLPKNLRDKEFGIQHENGVRKITRPALVVVKSLYATLNGLNGKYFIDIHLRYSYIFVIKANPYHLVPVEPRFALTRIATVSWRN